VAGQRPLELLLERGELRVERSQHRHRRAHDLAVGADHLHRRVQLWGAQRRLDRGRPRLHPDPAARQPQRAG
jgi:hypothetical protein